MDELLKLIKTHQIEIGQHPPKNRIEYIRNLTLAAHVELTEFLNELPWKPWKEYPDNFTDTEAASEELADVFIFLLDLWLALGTTEDLEFIISRKIKKNIKRLDKGDHKKHE